MTPAAWGLIGVLAGIIANALFKLMGFSGNRLITDFDKKIEAMDAKYEKRCAQIDDHLKFTDGRVDKVVENHNAFEKEVFQMETRIVDRINDSIKEAIKQVTKQ